MLHFWYYIQVIFATKFVKILSIVRRHPQASLYMSLKNDGSLVNGAISKWVDLNFSVASNKNWCPNSFINIITLTFLMHMSNKMLSFHFFSIPLIFEICLVSCYIFFKIFQIYVLRLNISPSQQFPVWFFLHYCVNRIFLIVRLGCRCAIGINDYETSLLNVLYCFLTDSSIKSLVNFFV